MSTPRLRLVAEKGIVLGIAGIFRFVFCFYLKCSFFFIFCSLLGEGKKKKLWKINSEAQQKAKQ